MVCGTLIVNGDGVVVDLRLCQIGLLIDLRHCGYSPVVEWLVLENFSKVWCGGV